jgi:carboxyl-terminal processing protease
MEKISKMKYISATVFFLILFFVFGVYVGNVNSGEAEELLGISGKENTAISEIDFSPFWKVWQAIDKKYPEASKINGENRVYGAISGLVGSLNDPYSVFFTPEEAKSFEEEIAGNFEGIGMEIVIKDDILTVVAPLKDTPAYRADIKPGDKILKINDTSTIDLSAEEGVKLIRGPKGTEVTLTILREGWEKAKEIKVTRDIINIPTIDTELRGDGIFVIELYSFSANSAKLFRNAIKDFANSGSDKLILDLRGNPGGYLDAAVDISSWFLESGKTVVVEDYANNKDPKIYRSKGYDVFTDKLKFIILIDGGSASASEIVAGALQDHKRAVLVGSQSFGKGSVQEVIDITKDTLLKITVAKWLTPNGNSISEKGLTPDYEINITERDLKDKKDPQMDKAVELLLKK